VCTAPLDFAGIGPMQGNDLSTGGSDDMNGTPPHSGGCGCDLVPTSPPLGSLLIAALLIAWAISRKIRT
jgi:hypothetical protein